MRYVEGAPEIIGDIGSIGALVLSSRRFRLQTPYVLLHVAPKSTDCSTNRTREANFEINLNEILGGGPEIIGDIGSIGALVLISRRFWLQTLYVLLHVAPKSTDCSTNRTREANFEINLNEIRGGGP